MAEGYTNQEIADRIFTSKRTVEGHRRTMIDSAGVKNTAALIRFAMRKKIID
jgi:DNA-binding NarL/FixJ family response regulator